MPTVSTSATTNLGTIKLILGGLTLIIGLAYGILSHDWATAGVILAGGGTGAGLLSGVGLIKAADEPNK